MARSWWGLPLGLLLSLLSLGCSRGEADSGSSAPVTPASNETSPEASEPNPVQLASYNPPAKQEKKSTAESKEEDADVDPDLKLDPVEAMNNFDSPNAPDDELSPEKEKELLAMLAKSPRNPQVLFALANFMLLKADASETGEPDYSLFKQSASYLRRAVAADAKLAEADDFKSLAPFVFFNEARALAKDKQVPAGLRSLRQAVDQGWNNVTALNEELDFAVLRKSPNFEKIVTLARDKRKAEVKTLVSALFIEKPEYKFDFDLTDSTGKPLAKKDFAGKVLVVNVWGTWCGPCRMELPDLVRISKKFKPRGVEMIGLNNEYEMGATANASIRDTQKAFGITYRCALGDEALFQQIPNFGTVPMTLFFDRSGTLQVQWDGVADEILLEMIIERLLEEPVLEAKKAKATTGQK